jgi:hypothetical protein
MQHSSFSKKKRKRINYLKKQNIGHNELHDLTEKKTKTYITCCIDKIEPLTRNQRSIYVYNETNRKISRLDRIDKN